MVKPGMGLGGLLCMNTDNCSQSSEHDGGTV